MLIEIITGLFGSIDLTVLSNLGNIFSQLTEGSFLYGFTLIELLVILGLADPTAWLDSNEMRQAVEDGAFGPFDAEIIGNNRLLGLAVGTDGNDFIDTKNGLLDLAFGLDGNDIILGGNGIDILYGGDGNDAIWGDNTADILSGGAGSDLIKGEGGNDLIYGDAGVDRLFGGTGDDHIWLGADADIDFVYYDNIELFIDLSDPESASASVINSGSDIIYDFVVGDDQIIFNGQAIVAALLIGLTPDPAGVINEADVTFSEVGGDSIIDLGNGESITLVGVTGATLEDVALFV